MTPPAIDEIESRLAELSRRTDDRYHERVMIDQFDGRELQCAQFLPVARRNPIGIVICPSWLEATSFQNAEITLLRRAAGAGSAGTHWLPPGFGDSKGSQDEATFACRVRQGVSLGRRLLDQEGVTRVCFVGARLAAVVAVMAGAELGDAGLAVAWEPVWSGREYWDQLKRTARMIAAAGRRSWFEGLDAWAAQPGPHLLDGLEISESTRNSILEVTLGPVATRAAEALILESAHRPRPELLTKLVSEVTTLPSTRDRRPWDLSAASFLQDFDAMLGWMQDRA